MTLVPKISLLVLAAPKPPGPVGKKPAPAVGKKLPASSPGPVGKNDKQESTANGSAAAMPGVVAKNAAQGAAAVLDPLEKAVAYSRINLSYNHVAPKELNREVDQLFKALGYGQRVGDDRRKRMNSVIRRLSVPVAETGAREPDLLREIYFWADREGLNPIFLAAALFTEAFWPMHLPKNPDNFDFIGMDRFELELDDMITENLLSSDFKKGHFKHTGEIRFGEKGAVYKQIRFNDVSTTVQAFAAFLKHRRNFLMQDLKELGFPNPSADEVDFWNYIYYNAGGKTTAYTAPDGTLEKGKDTKAAGFRHLKHEVERVEKKLNPGGSLIPVRVFPDVNGNVDSRDVAQRMLLIKKLLQQAGMADPADPNTMKFQFIEDLGKMMEKLRKNNKTGSLLDL